MIYVQLFLAFFKTGLFAVGGGLATLPFLYEISDTWHWFSHADIADMIAISESTPGAIGINMSTYAGFLTAGVPGGFIATLGLGTPCVIIILIIARILKKFKDNPYVEKAFYGAAGINVARIALVDLPAFQETGSILRLFVWKAILLALILYFAMKKVKLHPIAFIAISALVGILFHFGGV